ncbi:MAG: sugar ABC transporter substrate-binding protein [Treponema sp.]|jgi:multiple sugar transport system substrate-binding protein|nr:sugar ABC transporter substrate-binding protein [Treponema sp.]
MKKNLKKALLFALPVFLAMTLAACNKGGGSAGRTQTPRELVFWDMIRGPADTYSAAAEKLTAQYNAENKDNIRVTISPLPWDNYYQVFLTAVTSGVAPDISTGAFMQSVQYAEMGEGLPLDPVIDMWKKENNPILREYSDAIFDLLMYEGKHYGLPVNLDTRQITYRTDYFNQAGISKLPATWDEFEEACAKLKAALPADVYPIVFPGGGDYSGIHPTLSFLFQNGVGPTDAEGNPDFLNPKVTETLQFFHRLYVKGYVPEGLPAYVSSDAQRMYQSGKAAMFFQNVPQITDFPEVNNNSAIMPPMAGPSGIAQYYTWVNAIQAYSQTEDPDACYLFVKWWLENTLLLWTEGGMTTIPARSSYWSDSVIADNWARNQISKLVNSMTTPVYPSPTVYLPFSVIEGEGIPTIGMVKSMIRGEPDYAAIQKEVQEAMLTAWKQFEN